MARATFGATAADYVIASGAGGLLRVTPATLTFWTDPVGGTQFTDLILNGSPTSTISVGDDGMVPAFLGPDGETQMWADAGGIRVRIVAGGEPGPAGDNGTNGWAPICALVTDGSRRVLQIVDWTGGTGTKPSTTNQFIGASGIVSSAAAAVDVRGATGPANTLTKGTVLTGAPGSMADIEITGTAPNQTLSMVIPTGFDGGDGANGWAPICALVADGSRRVLQIVDWTGGTGTKPSVTNQFIGASGIVSSAAAAVDIRGTAGAPGPANTLTKGTVTTGAPGTDADFTITGTAPNQVLDMTIPEGNPGFNGVYGPVGTLPGPYPDGTVTFEY